MAIPEYNLINVLHQYEQYLTGEKSENTKDKTELANRVSTIMLTGVGQYNNEQVTALKDFKDRFTKDYPKDRLIGLISEMSDNGLLVEKKQNLPSDMKASVLAYKDIKTFNQQSNEMKQKIAAYATNQILHEENLGAKDLAQFAKIIQSCWDEPYMRQSHFELVSKMNSLIDEIGKKNTNSVQEESFLFNATSIRSKHRDNIFPKELKGSLQDHEVEIGEFVAKFQGIPNGKLVDKYCELELKPRTYLIRESSLKPSRDKEGVTYYPVTVSKKRSDNQIMHSRMTCVTTKEGDVSWRHGAPPFTSENEGKSFKTLDELIKNTPDFKGYKSKDLETRHNTLRSFSSPSKQHAETFKKELEAK